MIYILIGMFSLNAFVLMTIVYLVNKRLDTLSKRYFRMAEYIEKVIAYKYSVGEENERL